MQTFETTEPTPSAANRALALRVAFLGAALIVVLLDQLTKAGVRTFLDRGESWPDADWPLKIRYVTNTGAAFGILQDQTVFLVVMAVVGLAAIYLYYRNPPFNHWIAAVAIGMMLGGALGNLIDRVRVERVTDFIDFDHYPAFNVADSSIFIGVTVVIIGYLLLGEGQRRADSEQAADGQRDAHEDVPADG